MSKTVDQLTQLTSVDTANDKIPIFDASDPTELKYATPNDIAPAVPDATDSVKGKSLLMAGQVHAATDKTTPVDADEFGLIDSATSFVLKKLSWANLKATLKTYFEPLYSVAPQNLLKNGNFINNSTNGYGSTPDDWNNSNANPVQGGIPELTKQQLIDILGVADGDIEGLWPCNGFVNTDDIDDLSSNNYDLDCAGHVPGTSPDGLMGTALDFESTSSQYGFINDAACPNLEISGSQTWIAFYKPESIKDCALISKRKASAAAALHGLFPSVDAYVSFYLGGLTTATNIASDVKMQAGKWYMIVGVYDAANSKLKIWINGIKKETTASGSASDSNANFAIGADYSGGSDAVANFSDGLIQNAAVLSVALSDDQVKRLLVATLYKGQKIRRSTTNAIFYQDLPMDLVERLRGKTVAIRADMYQSVASTGQISILQTLASGSTDETIISATDAATGSWMEKVATGVISTTAVGIRIQLKHSTSDGNTWFKKVSLYEGASMLPYDHSKDDWSRFPNLLKMRIPHVLSGYQYEQFRIFTGTATPSYRASGSMTYTSVTTSVNRFVNKGDTIQSFLSCSGTIGGSASVALYYTLQFIVDTSIIATGNGGHACHNVDAAQEAGVARLSTENEMEVYRYTGGNWTLGANRAIQDNAIELPVKYS